MKPKRSFSASIGQRSQGNAGPDQIEYDLDQAFKMFDPLETDGGIRTENIVDANITTAKIADLAVTANKISDNSIYTNHLVDNTVNRNKIINGEVTTEKLANAAVTIDKLDPNISNSTNLEVVNARVSSGVTYSALKDRLDMNDEHVFGEAPVETLTIDTYTAASNTISVYYVSLGEFKKGKKVIIEGAGVGGADLHTTIKSISTNSFLNLHTIYFTDTIVTDPTGKKIKHAPTITDQIGSLLKRLDWVSVKEYGAVGDGVANDKQAILDAIASGKSVYFPKGTYHVGDVSAYGTIFALQGIFHTKFLGDNAEITCRTTDQTYPKLFSFDNCAFLKFTGLRFRDLGYDNTVDWKGIEVFYLNPTTSEVNNIDFEDIYCNNVVSFISTNGASIRAHTVNFENVRVKDSYYAINCKENGDYFTGKIRTDNVKRSYFVYGVTGHRVVIDSWKHQINTSADVLIKTYTRNTTNLKIDYTSHQTEATGYHVSLEHHHNTGAGIMKDIDIYYNDSENTKGSSIVMRSYNSSGSLETTTTNRWDNISIKGTARTGVTVESVQSTRGRLFVEPGIQSIRGYLNNYKGFYLQNSPNEIVGISRGNLSVNSIPFDLSFYDGMSFQIIVKVWATNSTVDLMAQASTIQEDVLIGYKAGGAALTIQQNNNIHKSFITTDAGVTFTVDGANLRVNFPNYTNANGYAMARVEFI